MEQLKGKFFGPQVRGERTAICINKSHAESPGTALDIVLYVRAAKNRGRLSIATQAPTQPVGSMTRALVVKRMQPLTTPTTRLGPRIAGARAAQKPNVSHCICIRYCCCWIASLAGFACTDAYTNHAATLVLALQLRTWTSLLQHKQQQASQRHRMYVKASVHQALLMLSAHQDLCSVTLAPIMQGGLPVLWCRQV